MRLGEEIKRLENSKIKKLPIVIPLIPFNHKSRQSSNPANPGSGVSGNKLMTHHHFISR
jgi:hypothetical protein